MKAECPQPKAPNINPRPQSKQKPQNPQARSSAPEANPKKGPGTAEHGSAAASKSADTTALQCQGLEDTAF